MYSEITRNKRKTSILITLFVVIFVAMGWVFGEYYGSPSFGIIAAVIISTIMTLVGYYKGDAIALKTAGAREIQKRDNPLLYSLVENLSITAGLPTPKIHIIPDSAPNAFATGRKPETASVAFSTGLLKILTKEELEGVVAHELSHIKNYDIRVMTIVVVLVGTIMLLSDWLLRSFIFRDRDSNQGTLILALIGIGLAILSPLLAELIKLAVSRSREYLADASGALLTRYPEGLASALEKIAKLDRPMKKANHATAHMFLANPFDPHVTKKFEKFFSTHPPIDERIAKLRKMGV